MFSLRGGVENMEELVYEKLCIIPHAKPLSPHIKMGSPKYCNSCTQLNAL